MLKPRETDIPALFLVFVVLPLVIYFLLGKWSKTAKRKDRISLNARQATEEAQRVEDMAIDSVAPVMHLPNIGIHNCVRCLGPAATRCSQCKSVWYCSGRCQILHWRQVHKLECQHLGTNCQTSSAKLISSEGLCGRVSSEENIDSHFFDYSVKQPSTLNVNDGVERSRQNAFAAGYNHGNFSSSGAAISCKNPCAIRMDLIKGEYLSREEIPKNDETKGFNCSSERASTIMINKARTQLHSHGMKLDTVPNSQAVHESRIATVKDNIPLQDSNRVASLGSTTTMGLMKSLKFEHQKHSDGSIKKPKKVKMLFSYEEFVKYFQFEVFNVSPRGLVNCGNSCYANAVLQCLMCTKPLITYLLRQSHSTAGCAKDWCLMCELEQLVMMLRESGGPLSPTNILLHIRSLNSQMGDGSQEDAHEFLRLLVASMQSICLEGLGAENLIDPRLQDTTFIQHMFGGRLRSKVKCLSCRHESERHENIMDLTLEIFGWVESLEDALTQFTRSEDLDGENMYRCGRCAAYVRAQKELSIQEAPNILTIVLKRFQKGNYGKINKRITFPEMLDMIPFMTGTDDIPPFYMLYAVVVHLNTSNASFSGHYISYVKDLQGNWFKIDDSKVHPVDLNQVMSEGAYILFYMRSYPRPAKGRTKKATQHQNPAISNQCPSKLQTPSRPEQSKPNYNIVSRQPYLDHRLQKDIKYTDISNRYMEFSDATSDWSLFTSSDDASFTSESTRDSFSSTVDYADGVPFFSIFKSLYPAADYTSRRTVSCCMVTGSKPQTRLVHEVKGFVSVSSPTTPQSW